MAHAAIVYSGVQNISVPQNFTGIYVNLLTNTTAGAQPVDFNSAPWVGLAFGGIDISNDTLLQVVITAPDQVVRLTTADSVGSPSSFSTDANYSTTHTGPASSQFQIVPAISALNSKRSPLVRPFMDGPKSPLATQPPARSTTGPMKMWLGRQSRSGRCLNPAVLR